MKLPFSFSLKFVFRLLLPGFILALGLIPLMQTTLDIFDVDFSVQYAFLLLVIICGWAACILDMPIYMFFEGRRYWPTSLRNLFLRREQVRLERLSRKKEKYKINKRASYLEVSVEIRKFPMDSDGLYTVKYPSRLGNLIASYEDYPLRVYGMDAVFYWPRIWLMLSEDQRKELDDQQALADSAVYSSGSLYFVGTLCAIYLLIETVLPGVLILPSSPEPVLLAAGVFCYSIGFLVYRACFHIHSSFGELFKSVFDIYRDKIDVDDVIKEVAQISSTSVPADPSQNEKYEIAWRYLHNYRIKRGGSVYSPQSLKKENDLNRQA